MINSDLYAPNPVSNPQIINQNKPSPYIPSNKRPYEPNIQSQENHHYNGNSPSNIYPYDQNNSPTQGFPYYNASPEPFPNNEESVENNLSHNPNQRKCQKMILVMPILMLIFLFCENRILSPKGKDDYNKFIIADEIGILICAIIYLITFIFNKRIKNNILKLRTIITLLFLFIGFVIRMFGFGGHKNNSDTFFDINEELDFLMTQITFWFIRGLLLAISGKVSFDNSKTN